jgi:acetyl-CoA carboxylase carboxyltransferase component
VAEQVPRPASAGGIPRGVSIGESWPAMVSELRADKAGGYLESAGRRLVEQLIPPPSFTEVGRLIGVSSEPAGSVVGDRIPGEVVAGWGDTGGQILFAVADEALTLAPRNPAGAAVAWNVASEALRCGAPLVTFPAATRMREDLRPAANFMRAGVQLDLSQEQASAAAIPKVMALCGAVDLPVAVEMALAHYVIAGPGAEIRLPGGSAVDASRLGELGWADAICLDERDVIGMVRAVLSLLPGASGSLASPARSGDSAGLATAELESLLFDPGTAIGISGHAAGSLLAGLGTIGGNVAAVASGTVSGPTDEVRIAKLLRLCRAFSFPLIVIADGFEPDEAGVAPHQLTDLLSILVIAGPEIGPALAAYAENFAAVLSFGQTPGSDADALVDSADVREVINTLLTDLNRGHRPARGGLRRSASSALDGWVSDAD